MRAGRGHSDRCPTEGRGDLLRRGGGRRFELGQGAFPRFGRISQGCRVIQCVRIRSAIARGQKDVRDGRGVFALGGPS